MFKRSYKTFAPYELAFALPVEAKPNHPYRSITFYGVILKKATQGAEPNCDNGEYSSGWEKERRRVQKLVAKRKVFADHQCPDMGAVTYLIDDKPNTRPLIAIYGGPNRKEAEAVKEKMVKRYPRVSIHRMAVVFEVIMQ